MFCDQCGTEIKDGIAFCPNCGAKQDIMPQRVEGQQVEVAIPDAVQDSGVPGGLPLGNEPSGKKRIPTAGIIAIAAAGLAVVAGIIVLVVTGGHLRHEWEEATCTEPEICAICGKTQGEPLGHIALEATCTEASLCDVCGKKLSDPPGHTVLAEATCTEPSVCSVCSATLKEALGHTWQEATCLAPKTCSVCKKTEGGILEHSWQEATCLTARTCMACGKTEGAVGNHIWVDATCLEPRTCRVCGETEGEIGNHTWQEATCSAPRTCNICGETEGDKEPHKYIDEDTYCARCGAYGKVSITAKDLKDYLDISFEYVDSVDKNEVKIGSVYKSDPWHKWWRITVSPKSDKYIFNNFTVGLRSHQIPVGPNSHTQLPLDTSIKMNIDNDGNGVHYERLIACVGDVEFRLMKIEFEGIKGDCLIK